MFVTIYMLKKYINLFGGLTPPTPFVTSIEADFAYNAYSKHTCKVHVRPSRDLVHFKKCFSAFSSNTPGRHCRKKTKNFFLLKRTNSRLGLYMYFATVFTLRITDKVCLDWRRGQRPLGLGSTLKFVNNISTDKNCLFTFHSSKHISHKSFILKKYHRWL